MRMITIPAYLLTNYELQNILTRLRDMRPADPAEQFAIKQLKSEIALRGSEVAAVLPDALNAIEALNDAFEQLSDGEMSRLQPHIRPTTHNAFAALRPDEEPEEDRWGVFTTDVMGAVRLVYTTEKVATARSFADAYNSAGKYIWVQKIGGAS